MNKRIALMFETKKKREARLKQEKIEKVKKVIKALVDITIKNMGENWYGQPKPPKF